MRASTTAFAILSVFRLASATPTPVELAPRCGTTLQPSFLQQLKEADPTSVGPNTLASDGDFHVEQGIDPNGHPINRIYQVAAFTGIPAGSFACTLSFKFPPSYTITTTGTPTLNVSTLYKDDPSKIVFPNTFSWSKFFPPLSPPFGQGLFGTTNLAAGQTSTINSQGCPVGGGNMAFVFEIASWISGAASVDFKQAPGAGFFLTFNC
jgi:hypothetical protein